MTDSFDSDFMRRNTEGTGNRRTGQRGMTPPHSAEPTTPVLAWAGGIMSKPTDKIKTALTAVVRATEARDAAQEVLENALAVLVSLEKEWEAEEGNRNE